MDSDQAQGDSREGQPPSGPSPDHILSSEHQISRFDSWGEFFSTIVLALATVAIAWCAYQSTLWGGDETKYRSAANAQDTPSHYASVCHILERAV